MKNRRKEEAVIQEMADQSTKAPSLQRGGSMQLIDRAPEYLLNNASATTKYKYIKDGRVKDATFLTGHMIAPQFYKKESIYDALPSKPVQQPMLYAANGLFPVPRARMNFGEREEDMRECLFFRGVFIHKNDVAKLKNEKRYKMEHTYKRSATVSPATSLRNFFATSQEFAREQTVEDFEEDAP